MPYLVKYHDNYADEFDVDGLAIMGERELGEFMAALCIGRYLPMEFYFGTNEFIDYAEPSELDKAFSFEWITPDEATFLQHKVFNGRMDYGIIPVDNILEGTYNAEEE